jgi:hypothetical protein
MLFAKPGNVSGSATGAGTTPKAQYERETMKRHRLSGIGII